MSAFKRNGTNGQELALKLRQPIRSAPALAAAIRHTDQAARTHLAQSVMGKRQLAPVYQIDVAGAEKPVVIEPMRAGQNGTANQAKDHAESYAEEVDGEAEEQATQSTIEEKVEEEATAAVPMLLTIADRLRRLVDAYGEWQEFEVGPYFDLTDAQAKRLVKVAERVSTVHVTFFADLLLPSFQQAEACWAQDFYPAYHIFRQHLAHATEPLPGVTVFTRDRQPRMIARWQHLNGVIARIRALIQDDIGFLAANNSEDERSYWRWAWVASPASGLVKTLKPPLQMVPTLTLSVDFPLPASRQPDRLRRLRQGRERRSRARRHRFIRNRHE